MFVSTLATVRSVLRRIRPVATQPAPVRPRPRVAGAGGLELRHCSRCDHPFFEVNREQDPQWFVLCPDCSTETQETVVALSVLFVFCGLLVLAVQV